MKKQLTFTGDYKYAEAKYVEARQELESYGDPFNDCNAYEARSRYEAVSDRLQTIKTMLLLQGRSRLRCEHNGK